MWLQAIHCKATNLIASEITKSFISVFTGTIGPGIYSDLPQSTTLSVVTGGWGGAGLLAPGIGGWLPKKGRWCRKWQVTHRQQPSSWVTLHPTPQDSAKKMTEQEHHDPRAWERSHFGLFSHSQLFFSVPPPWSCPPLRLPGRVTTALAGLFLNLSLLILQQQVLISQKSSSYFGSRQSLPCQEMCFHFTKVFWS